MLQNPYSKIPQRLFILESHIATDLVIVVVGVVVLGVTLFNKA